MINDLIEKLESMPKKRLVELEDILRTMLSIAIKATSYEDDRRA